MLHMDKTLVEEISDTYPQMTGTQIRNLLASFLFTGDDVFKRIRDLSGGERGRLSLARLMLSEANFLILDEPTNHLDIVSKEITLDRVLKLYGNGSLRLPRPLLYQSDGYANSGTQKPDADQLYWQLRLLSGEKPGAFQTGRRGRIRESVLFRPVQSVPAGMAQQKEAQARERKRKNEIKKAEEEISRLEERDKEIDGLLEQEEIFTDLQQCTALMNEKAQITEQLNALYERWEALSSEEE